MLKGNVMCSYQTFLFDYFNGYFLSNNNRLGYNLSQQLSLTVAFGVDIEFLSDSWSFVRLKGAIWSI